MPVSNLQSKNCSLDFDIYLKMSVDLGNLPKKLHGFQVFFRILICFQEKINVFSVIGWPQCIFRSGLKPTICSPLFFKSDGG